MCIPGQDTLPNDAFLSWLNHSVITKNITLNDKLSWTTKRLKLSNQNKYENELDVGIFMVRHIIQLAKKIK